MSILVNEKTKLIVQGITGKAGWFHTKLSIDYGTQVVGGVTPGKGGSFMEEGSYKVPVFDSVKEAVEKTGANATVIFVPPPFAADAILEAAHAGIELIVTITEGIPINDMIAVKEDLKRFPNTLLVGPNCPGVTTIGVGRIGIQPGSIGIKGSIGVLSRSSRLCANSSPCSMSATMRTARLIGICCPHAPLSVTRSARSSPSTYSIEIK